MRIHGRPSALCAALASRSLFSLAVLLSCLIASQAASAANPLGAYVGAGVGQWADPLDSTNFSAHATGWKALVGLRPLRWLGAEIEYVDLGHPSEATAFSAVPATAQARGAALLGVGYLPLGRFDVYGKAGASRLHTSAVVPPFFTLIPIDTCYFHPETLGCHPFHDDREATKFAWAGGVEVKLSAFALRAEYERFGSGNVRPSLAGLTVSWTF